MVSTSRRPQRLEPAVITADPSAQLRSAMDQGAVADYADAMRAGQSFPPIVVFHDGQTHWLADGFHRHAAALAAKVKTIAAEVRPGSLRDAILFSAGANASHGLRRTNSDKRRAVTRLLEDAEWSQWSDREIAERCAVTREYVNRLRPTVAREGGASESRLFRTKHGTIARMDTSKLSRKAGETRAPRAAARAADAMPAVSADLSAPWLMRAPEAPSREAALKAALELLAGAEETPEELIALLHGQDCEADALIRAALAKVAAAAKELDSRARSAAAAARKPARKAAGQGEQLGLLDLFGA